MLSRIIGLYGIVKGKFWVVEPADEAERSLPGVGIPVLG